MPNSATDSWQHNIIDLTSADAHVTKACLRHQTQKCIIAMCCCKMPQNDNVLLFDSRQHQMMS